MSSCGTRLGLVGLLTLLGACSSTTTEYTEPVTLVAGCDAEMASALEAWEGAGFQGSVAIVEAGETRCLAGYGVANRDTGEPNGPDTVFSIGSASKTFTAAAVLKLQQQGTLTLQDPVGRWIEPWPDDKADMKVGDLVLHTSGLGSSHGQDHVPLSADEALANISAQPLLFPPGEGYQYSNSGYTLAALVVQSAAGEPFRDYLQREVMTLGHDEPFEVGGFWDGEPAPQGKRAVGYDAEGNTGHMGRPGDDDHWALDGNGGQALSTKELATWTVALTDRLVIDDDQLKLMREPQVDFGDGTAETAGWVYVAPELFGSPLLATTGGGGNIGHSVSVAWFPERDIVAVVSSNAASAAGDNLLEVLAPALANGEPLPRPPDFVPLSAEQLTAVVGSYTLPEGDTLAVKADGTNVELFPGGADAVEALWPIPGAIGAQAVAAHEEAARAFVMGETAEGRAERELLEAELGTIQSVTLDVTVFDGELRTYFTLVTEQESALGWLALSPEGVLEGAEIFVSWPSLPMGALSAGDQLVLVPRQVSELAPPIEARIDAAGSRLELVGPSSTAVALRDR